MKHEIRYLVEETSPNGRFSHALKHITAGELYTCFAGNSAEECERWAAAGGYFVEHGTPKLPTRIDLAKEAWAIVGDCELTGWKVGKGEWDYIKAYGKPKRAKYEYVHLFMFCGQWLDKGYANVLVTIIRAPWHEDIRWRGSFPTNRKHLYKHFANPTFAMV